MKTLEDLPAEIILQVHLLSTSSALPGVSRYLQSCITHNATPTYRARWLTLRLARDSPWSASSDTSARQTKRRRTQAHDGSTLDPHAQLLNAALRYPICDLDTLQILEKRCLDAVHARMRKRFHEQQARKKADLAKKVTAAKTAPTDLAKPNTTATTPPPYPSFLPVPPRSIEIPKRLFRNLHAAPPPQDARPSSSDLNAKDCKMDSTLMAFNKEDLPLLLHVVHNLQANPNSSRGYPLAKAVLARHVPLIQLLLDKGADPTVKDCMAVMLAIGRNDLEILKLLVEQQDEPVPSSSGLLLQARTQVSGMSSSSGTGHGSQVNLKKRKRNENNASPKRRKLEDRFAVSSAMLELAVKQQFEPLIDYFMSKGAVPNLKTLQMLQG